VTTADTEAADLDSVRLGRNFIRVGERHRVKAGGVDKTGFDLVISRLHRTAGGAVEVHGVVGRGHRRAGTIRCVPLERMQRLAQTKNGEVRFATKKR
jgi:hypothetical protein